MELNDAEDQLFARLSAPRLSTVEHRRAIDDKSPLSFDELSAIGIDTNILKALRNEPTFADRLFVTVEANQTTLVAPGQCIIEYWNNHKVFANDEWNAFKTDLTRLERRITSDAAVGHDAQAVEEIGRLVGILTSDLEESKSPGFMEKSRTLIHSLLDSATVPMVSRIRFASLADVRLASKVPPGWADGKTKTAAFGDFFGWCDFLLGVLCVEDPRARNRYAFVTDDIKPDWRTGPSGHPALIAEFDWICDGELSILTLNELRGLLTTDAPG
jgi:hypothetical protein